MNEIIDKGYARASDSTRVDGKLWYLVDHGTYHPKKPNKICVALECPVEYAERSVNKKTSFWKRPNRSDEWYPYQISAR